jgi:putative Ca2+/H+ antiporter (TMEM165/GDT1 family)
MSGAIGPLKTVLVNARDTVLCTMDNFAAVVLNAARAHQSGDSLWAVFVGTAIGYLPSMLGLAVGPAAVKRLPERFRSERTLKIVTGVALMAIGICKVWSGWRTSPNPTPAS